MRTDLMHTIFQHDLTNLTLVGHGAGGKLALTMASHYPELINKIVVINTTPFSTVPDTIGNPQAYIYYSITQALNMTLSECKSEYDVVEKVRS